MNPFGLPPKGGRPQFNANIFKSFIDFGNANKNCNNDIIIIRLIVCQKSFCGRSPLGDNPQG